MSLSDPLTLTAKCGEHEISFENGKLAKQADGSVVVRCNDSMVLVTCVSKEHDPSARFFPMVVDYVEKTYAGGKIPGGFRKREARLSDHEVLMSRLTDRPIRPLFPEGFKGNTQITATVISHDGETDTAILAMTGASAALMLSAAPFEGPIAGVRVGRLDGKLVANPAISTWDDLDIHILMACSKDAIVMVEGEADEVSEDEMLEALEFGFAAVQDLLDVQIELAARRGKDSIEWSKPAPDKKLVKKVEKVATKGLEEALQIGDKLARYAALDALKKEVVEALEKDFPERSGEVKEALDELKGSILRAWVLDDQRRIDGRGLTDIRAIECEVGTLPRAHGSSLFTRGETQALASVTFGVDRAAQIVEGLNGKREEHFYLHYNFPPFSVGEIKMLRGPGRREIGHGTLAQRSLEAVIPLYEEFPYTIRVVSEVLESNGSSSMATVCSGALALMDAGVPITKPVAGIAMGLIYDNEDRYGILSDILGDEDHLGDMDFKVTGTRDGLCALQMDIKIKGLSTDLMKRAMQQAREGRFHILREMDKAMSSPRADLKAHAPRIHQIQISQDRIRDIIGAGGKTIRSIQERTGTQINVDDFGMVKIASSDETAAQQAIEIVKALTASPVPGEIYLGTVAKVTDFGAFVTILPNVDGLCHISELSNERVERTTDICKEGDEIVVKCLQVESNGKVRLSRKEALGKEPTVVAGSLNL